jgi:hypothetical protein
LALFCHFVLLYSFLRILALSAFGCYLSLVQDTALMRPGRLDRLIYVGPPSFEDRISNLRVKMDSMAVGDGVDVEELARVVRFFRARVLEGRLTLSSHYGMLDRWMFGCGADSYVPRRGIGYDE